MNLSGNTVLITGGSSGIGFALAEAFLAAGSEVIICGRREDRLEAAKAKHPELHVKTCDVADPRDRLALAQWTTMNFRKLNILVNNAGIQRDIDFTRGLDDFLAGESEIAINLEAPIALAGLFVPHLAGQKGAAIVNVSSGLGFIPMAKMPVYCATKAALHAFSLALRQQLLRLKIDVFEVIPPAVDTELNPAGRAKRGGFKADLSAETFVAAVMKGFAADEFEIGYGMTADLRTASRADLDKRFQMMNSRG